MISKADWDAAILDHLELVPGCKLPEIATPEGIKFWDEWRERFQALQIPLATIRQALRDVRANPPREHARHMPAVLDRAISLRTVRETARMLAEYRKLPDEPAFKTQTLRSWRSLSAEAREGFRDLARERNPGLALFPSLLEPVARAIYAEQRAPVRVRTEDPASDDFGEDRSW